MKVLLKKATIICAHSNYHLQVKDILLTDGIITNIENDIIEQVDETISYENLHVSIGWLDIFSDFAEPGNEYRETLETGAKAATAGGFTDVMVIPNTNPTTDTKAQIEFLKQRSISLPINILPIGAITKNTDGEALAEMYDMHNSGAIAFSDGKNSIQKAGVLLKALQYCTAINATIIQIPYEASISQGGLMHEGIISTQLGLPGIPSIGEEIQIAKDIALLQYSNAHLHFTGVTLKSSVDLIEKAKKEGLNITCSVTPYHLAFCDEDLQSYNTNLKVNPPLRTKADMYALQDALKNGLIDCIASHHVPQSWDDKVCEFEYAKNGMITLQTTFSTINEVVNDVSKTIELLTTKNRNIFGIDISTIELGQKASLTLFSPTEEFIFKESNVFSKSKNSAFIGKKLKGKVVGIFTKNKLVLN
jgi:dihydroorotase